MASEGPKFGATSANVNIGGVDWVNLSNPFADDNNTSTASIGPTYSSPDTISNLLKITNFGFGIPGGSTIDGVEVVVGRNQTDDSSLGTDFSVYLVIGGDDEQGTNKGTATVWPETETTATYGGAADKWGRDGALTVSAVNASNFGVEIAATNPNFDTIDTIFQIDYITMTVHYTEGAGGKSFMLLGVGP